MCVCSFLPARHYVMAYVSMSISRRLRREEDEIAGLYQGVEAALSSAGLPDGPGQIDRDHRPGSELQGRLREAPGPSRVALSRW